MDQVRRKRIRLPASNYEAGWYFVTICTDHRTNFLATIAQGSLLSKLPCAIYIVFDGTDSNIEKLLVFRKNSVQKICAVFSQNLVFTWLLFREE